MSASSQEGAGLDTYQAVVLAFRDFLTVAIHTILYERDVYPRASFLKARKYNYPVRQSRHPKVCRWIQDAVAAVEVEMLKVKDFDFVVLVSSLAVASFRFCKDLGLFALVNASDC